MNIKRNNFWSVAKAIAASLLFGISIGNAQFDVFITEIADPSNAGPSGRFVELYNSSDADINAENYSLINYTNTNTTYTFSQMFSLSGIIPANGFYIVGQPGFEEVYGFPPNQISTNDPVDSDGDDKIALLKNGIVYDMFGNNGAVSTITNGMNFENGRAERAATVTSSVGTWIATDWNVVSGNVDAPAGFDPGSWIGETEDLETVTFTFLEGADNTLPENQDHITEGVKLTRGSSGALFNIAVETEYEQGVSPLGTVWAIGLTSDNALDNFSAYSSLHDAVNGALNGFAEIEGKTFSMHVSGTDKYFDVTFNSWATTSMTGFNGPLTRGFSYTRATAIMNETEDFIEVVWNPNLQPGQLEAAITANGGSGKFLLEAGKTYLISGSIEVPEGKKLELVGLENNGGRPATIQPAAASDGSNPFENQMFNLKT
ncbi:lamin tail domain-containing protein, partial [Candidatus Marinimicrobia bacterium]|nr:lamin tail domain-containing protein [Candidatus Neomarinimicrobiota bacterium]